MHTILNVWSNGRDHKLSTFDKSNTNMFGFEPSLYHHFNTENISQKYTKDSQRKHDYKIKLEIEARLRYLAI